MAGFLDVCRFTPTAGGTTDWTFAVAAVGYQSPTAAGAVNGRLYKYRAESADLSQWEIGEGAYNSASGVFARTTVLFNSAGTTAKVNFTAPPQVAIVALKEDLLSIEEANSFTSAQQDQASTNLGTVRAVRVQKFTTSTTYFPDPHLLYAIIECVGGGGGGGGANCGSAASQYAGGGGGGAGYARKIATKATVGASQSVTIGSGGTAGAATPTNGGIGGTTSVGALCSAGGGGQGMYGSAGQQGSGGAGGSGITGDVLGGGSPGMFGEYYGTAGSIYFQSGQGGSSMFGGGGVGGIASASAQAGFGGTGYGAGGSGGIVASAVLGAAGGAGLAGLVAITEFCTQ